MASRHFDSRPSGIWFGLALFALACATSGGRERTPADESNPTIPDDETSSAEPAKKDEAEPVDNVREAAGDAKTDAPKAPSQGDDVQAVLQLTVEDSELDQYLKLGEPGRFPLKLAGSAVPQSVQLVKATKPVVITAPPSDKKEAVLVVTGLEIKGSDATVTYRYDVEGIRGTAYLKKTAHGWELKRSRIVEH
jgi:hypothetical protein